MFRLLALLMLSACSSAPLEQAVAGRTWQLWADVGTPGYPPPSVSAISITEMHKLRGPGVVATYLCRDRAMYVLREHATDEDWLSGVIVHELTHHKQCLEGRLIQANICLLEVEAYTAQMAWLRKLAHERGFLLGTNASNYAAHVERHMQQNFSRCL